MNFTKYNFKHTTILTKVSLLKHKLKEKPEVEVLLVGFYVTDMLRKILILSNVDIFKCRYFQMFVSTDDTPMLTITSFMAFFDYLKRNSKVYI